MAETKPVLGGCQTGFTSEQTVQKADILVADLIGYGFHAQLACLEQLFGLLNANRVEIVDRFHPGRLGETAEEGSFGQPGSFDDRCDRCACPVVERQPFLTTADHRIVRVPMAGERCEWL